MIYDPGDSGGDIPPGTGNAPKYERAQVTGPAEPETGRDVNHGVSFSAVSLGSVYRRARLRIYLYINKVQCRSRRSDGGDKM